jgi:hypothetical protein
MKRSTAIWLFGGQAFLIIAWLLWSGRPFYPASLTVTAGVPADAREVIENWLEKDPSFGKRQFSLVRYSRVLFKLRPNGGNFIRASLTAPGRISLESAKGDSVIFLLNEGYWKVDESQSWWALEE